jgi:hypothetical protein
LSWIMKQTEAASFCNFPKSSFAWVHSKR